MNVQLDVDPSGYDSAADALRAANSTVATAYDDLVGDLGGYGGMGGDDRSSEDWVGNYDPTARDAVAAIADLATAWGSLSRAATTSGANHRDANAGSHLRGDGGGTSDPGGTGEPREVSPSTPPSALGADDSGMPEGWDLVVDHLQGWAWPSADVDRLRQAAATWRATAGMLEYTPDDGASARALLDGQRSPEIPQASSRIQEVEGAARDIAATCRDLAESCDEYATQVESTRETIRGLLRDLLIEIAATAAVSALGSLVTFGGAAAAGAAVAVSRAISCARRIIAALVALKGVRAVATAVRSVGKLRAVQATLRRFRSLRAVRRRPTRGGRGGRGGKGGKDPDGGKDPEGQPGRDGPDDPDGPGDGDRPDLSVSDQRALRSLERQVTEHQEKLDAYRANPDAFDNQGRLANAPTPEIRQRIIDGRIRHLEHEIEVFQQQIDNLKGGG